MGPVEVLGDGNGVTPPPPGGGQSENITSRRTAYAGGKNVQTSKTYSKKSRTKRLTTRATAKALASLEPSP